MRWTPLVGLLILAGCGPDSPRRGGDALVVGVRAEAIKDGYEEPSDTSVLAVVNTNGSLCSGSLLAPNMVLTARHCVSPTLNDGGGVRCDVTGFAETWKPGSFLVSTAAEVSLGNAGEFFAYAVVPLGGYPGIPAFTSDDSDFCGNDLAVVLLTENVPAEIATPREPRFDELAPDSSFSAVGYGGIDNQGAGSGVRRRRDELSVSCVGLACEGDFIEAGEIRAEEWVGNGGVCQGDSGGPALDADGAVIGVASRGDPACDLSLYAHVAPYESWLANVAAYASGLGQYEAPAWAAGATVDPEVATPIGDGCDVDADCPSGRCLSDGVGQYCTRRCDEETAPCPIDEDYACASATDEPVCVRVYPTPPVPPPSYQRAETGGCTVSGGTPRAPWWLVGLVALGVMRRRTRRDRARSRRGHSAARGSSA